MIELERLKEAVKWYWSSLEDEAEDLSDQDIRNRMLIADALLSKEPITRTALEELGFDNAAVAGDAKRWILHIGEWALHANQLEYSGWFFQASPIPGGYTFKVFPQPKHIGALLSILLWLEEQK